MKKNLRESLVVSNGCPLLYLPWVIAYLYACMLTAAAESNASQEFYLTNSIISRTFPSAGIAGHFTLDEPTTLADESGQIKWKYQGPQVAFLMPALGDDFLYVCSDLGVVYAFDKNSGESQWQFAMEGGGIDNSFYTRNISPAVGLDGTVYVGSANGKVYALNGRNGDKKWEFSTGGPILSSPALGEGGLLYIGSNDGKVYGIEQETGEQGWEYVTGGAVHSSPAVGDNGWVYVGSQDGKLYALDGGNGTRMWEQNLRSGVNSSPAIGADGTIVVASDNDILFALHGDTGTITWEFVTDPHIHCSYCSPGEVAGSVLNYSSPSIGPSGTVFIGSDGYKNQKLYAVDMFTGSKKWDFVTDYTGVYVTPAISADGTVYVSAGHLYGLDTTTGMQKEVLPAGGWFSSAALDVDGTLFVGSLVSNDETQLYAFQTASPSATYAPWPMAGRAVNRTANAMNSVSYELVDGDGDTNNGDFVVFENRLQSSITSFREFHSEILSIRVRATFSDDSSTEQVFSLNLLDPGAAFYQHFQDVTPLGNGWHEMDWLGMYYSSPESRYLYHYKLGWIYPFANSKESIWLFSTDLGWLWVHPGRFPLMFRSQSNRWLWYEEKSSPAHQKFWKHYDETLSRWQFGIR